MAMNTTTSDDPIISQPRRPVDAHEPTLTAVRDSKLEDTADFLLGHPLEFINQHFDPSTPHDDLAEEFQNILVDKQLLEKIPWINERGTKSMKSGSLVRFRCMVQDNGFSPQYFPSSAMAKNTITGETRQVVLRYNDSISLPDDSGDWVLEHQRPDQMRDFQEKLPVICVDIPGEAGWLKDTYLNGRKFELEKAEFHDNDIVKNKLRHDAKHGCIVVAKIYGGRAEELQLNGTFDLIGILQQPEAERGDEDGESSDELGEDIDEFSILPVLHTVIVSPMSYGRLNREVTTSEFDFEGAAKVAKSFFETRLNGDKLAAEFLLLHLLSKIRHRKDGHLSGFLPLNISGFSPLSANGVSAGDSVFDALAQVIPRCCRVPVNLSDLASVRFAPGQFLEKTPKEKIVGLSAGELQVPDGTWLVVDELGLEPGKLNEQATLNVRHLSGLVADAKIPYAHGFGAGQQVAEFPMDVGVVILSATKSILPVDCVVPIDPNAVLGNEETTAADLDKIRELIHRCRSVSEYAIPSEIEKVSTSFFTHKRKTDSTYSPEQFSLRLELARSLSLLVGSSKMTMQAWRRSGELEEERARRLAEAKKGGSSSSGER